MKKSLISLAVATTVAGAAAVQAGQYVSGDKTGQVILFPFYNADNGNATNMHIVNTTDQVKAVKIRFVEYKNSDEVLDFNLYLSEHDHFAFGVVKNPAGEGGAVITADNSCTVPALGSANGDFSGTQTEQADGSIVRVQPFVNYQYIKDFDNSIERTLTGHVEVIEMGVVTDNLNDTKNAMYATYATHDAAGVPAACAKLDAAWASGEWSKTTGSGDKNKDGMTAPTGGLYGLAYHINVAEAAAFGFEPTAIDDWSSEVQHSNPGSLEPSIGNGSNFAVVEHGLGGDQHVEVRALSGTQATSIALATTSLSNDVMLNPDLGGQTDWVVSFPTKRVHVDYAAKTDVIAPFTDNWVGITGTTTKKEDKACEPVTIQQWDREEAYTAAENGFSPSPAATVTTLCNEVAVIAMGAAGTESAMEVETGLTNLGFPYAEGWQRFLFDQYAPIAASASTASTTEGIHGLPAIGFAAYKVQNGAMSYGNAAEHKTDALTSLGTSSFDTSDSDPT